MVSDTVPLLNRTTTCLPEEREPLHTSCCKVPLFVGPPWLGRPRVRHIPLPPPTILPICASHTNSWSPNVSSRGGGRVPVYWHFCMAAVLPDTPPTDVRTSVRHPL